MTLPLSLPLALRVLAAAMLPFNCALAAPPQHSTLPCASAPMHWRAAASTPAS